MKTLIEIDLQRLSNFMGEITVHCKDDGYKHDPYCRAGDESMSYTFGVVGGGVAIGSVDFKVVEPNKELLKLQEENKRLKTALKTLRKFAEDTLGE